MFGKRVFGRVFRRIGGLVSAFWHSGRNSGVGYRKASASQYQISKREQRKKLRGVFRQAAVARFAMTEQVLHDMERMLDFRAHAGLDLLEFFLHAAQLVRRQRLAFRALHRDMPSHRLAFILRPLFDALVAGVAKRGDLIAMQQRVRLRDVGDVPCGADQRVQQPGSVPASGLSAYDWLVAGTDPGLAEAVSGCRV
jgi:hypothetical protein